MEEHLWAEEALIANIDVHHISIDCFVHESLELVRLDDLSVLVRLFVILCELLVRVFAYITIPFFNLGSDLRGVSSLELLTSVLKCRESVLGDVPTGKWDVLDTTRDNVAIANWEDVSNTITSIDNSTSHGREIEVRNVDATVRSCNLRIQGECGLHTDEKSLHIESLEHDLSHLLSVLWRVHGWLRQDEAMIVWLTPDILVDRLVPELLNSVPITDLTCLEQVSQVMGSSLLLSFLTNEVVHLIGREVVLIDTRHLHRYNCVKICKP